MEETVRKNPCPILEFALRCTVVARDRQDISIHMVDIQMIRPLRNLRTALWLNESDAQARLRGETKIMSGQVIGGARACLASRRIAHTPLNTVQQTYTTMIPLATSSRLSLSRHLPLSLRLDIFIDIFYVLLPVGPGWCLGH